MTIRIRTCSDPQLWYWDYIGKEFTVKTQDAYEYIVITPGGYYNIVKIKDAEIV